ncbi:rab-like protein 6 isoform X2 [Arapaima gigas]
MVSSRLLCTCLPSVKIVIRGDRNTGKSTLWHRLQGKKFVEEYIPTQEIQVTSIHWNYKTTDDVVKVEVWDVVDKGQKIPLPEGIGKGKKRGESLKLENDPQETENEMALDAEFLDVYKNCNGVIMMFDITKQWTFSYILRELPKVPTHVPVCVLGNYRDMGEHRVILPDDIRDFISGLNRPLGSSYIHYAESSMKNGFGLKYLHRFFNIPFLQLQRETLLRQLETNQLDMDATLEELTVQQETEDQNYDIFLEMMEARSKGYGSPGPANGQSPSSGSQSPIVPPSGASTGSSSPGTPQPPIPPQTFHSPSPSQSSPPSMAPTPVMVPSVSEQSATAAPPQKRSIISRLFGSSNPEAPADKPGEHFLFFSEAPVAPVPAEVQSVDDFVPDDRLDRSFLEDSLPTKIKEKLRPSVAVESDSDGEGRGGNPLVAGFQDDLDPDDQDLPKALTQRAVPSKDITLSSDEEEEKPAPPVTREKDQGCEPDTRKYAEEAEGITSSKLQERPSSLLTGPAAAPENTVPAESSDTDQEGAPAAQQMLSFVVDDPDFDNEEPEPQKIKKESFPVRDDLSDLSDDEFVPPRVPETLKPTIISFKNKNDIDLFGLGFEENASKNKDSSEDQEGNKHPLKEKKKKKKKSKEEEDKSSKKQHKHKKKEKEEAATGDDKEEKKKRKKKSRSKKSGDMDDLEAFLAGEEGPDKQGGGDYEEL